ncbi:granulocyte colony-stimulating factor receptor isoform X2 [Dunckerocampus dactyliophorus]|uniref:granulocyte colony-stimulating factor receptor isoform X2 n=1 Tax=Dunckerocampus dactyliophorus TaxID=161453 RepID=UPI0024062444|nr:granulocyte colony-stimulating factor receptor isoform X2 [Dunckerocampus dactyliophorus]
MAATWMSVVVMLVGVADVYAVKNESDSRPCASVHASSSVVAMGSPVEATCTIANGCPLLVGDVEWRLDDLVFPSIPVANGSNRSYRVVIPSFTHTKAVLTCCVHTSSMPIIGGVVIRAGYPPPVPQNLSCQANLSTHRSLTCIWEANLQVTHLPTKSLNKNHAYELPPGVQSYTIPRTGFVLFSEMEIYVKAVNQLGEASSAPLTLEPVSSAKFDPPKIVKIQAVQLGCLRLRWDLSKHEHWMKDYMSLEVRLKTADSSLWNQPPILVSRVQPKKPVDRCRLLHGMQYVAQIRVQYQQSPWSEWSSSQSAVTMESAPTGLLDTWMRGTGDHMHKQLQMLLFWKPSQWFRANGRNMSYIVSVQKVVSKRGTLCTTARSHCTFQLPRRARKVYIIAVNAAGKSSPTQVRIYRPKAHEAISDVSAVALDNGSLLVQWKKLTSANLVDYVVEWRPLLRNDLSFVQFELAGGNMSNLVITGFEPYKPYGISVYPRFKDGIGRPQTVNAYSLQKAPSVVPNITIDKNWQSHVELTWDEIPLDQRNGIIRSYKLLYWDEAKRVHVAIGDLEERRVVLTGLHALSVYDAVLTVSTDGGSRNGSMVHFDIKGMDGVAVVLMVVLPGVGLALLFIVTVVSCYTKESRLKVRFWPSVPDPANSSIKSWTSESTQDIISSWGSEEPNPIYLSHLSFLELPMKPNKEEEDDSPWSHGPEDTSDLGESICGSPFLPVFSSSNSDSVPYATVIFPAPCSPPQQHPHVYLRSESTQPLLESEDLQSPKCYQNLACDGSHGEQCFFGPCGGPAEGEEAEPAIHWDDFPFLRSLAISDTQ